MYFLHISDTHHRADYDTVKDFFHDAFCNLQTLDARLTVLRKAIDLPLDFICHCGDICHQGELVDYQTAREAFQKHFPDTPFLVTAGNHDKSKLLQEVFLGESSDFFVEERGFSGFRVLSFDNSNGIPNCGEVTEQICTWLLERLQAEPQVPTLLMSHHHIFPEQSPMPPMVQHELFSQVLQTGNVVGYLTGHTHSPYDAMLGNIPYHTVGSLCFQGTDLGEGLLEVQEAGYYQLFSYENGLLTKLPTKDLGLNKLLGRVQRPQ